MWGEAVVGDDDVFVDKTAGGDVIDEPVEDGLFPNLQEWFGEVLGEGIETGGVACGENEKFHFDSLKV